MYVDWFVGGVDVVVVVGLWLGLVVGYVGCGRFGVVVCEGLGCWYEDEVVCL